MNKPILMGAGIFIIVAGTGLLVWLGPTFSARRPATANVDPQGQARSLLQKWESLDAKARQAAAPDLVKSLHVDDDDIRLDAALKLGALGKDALPALTPALEDPDANVRYYAVWAVAQMGTNATDALPAVRKALTDSNADVRRKAVFALGRIKPPADQAVPSLVAALLDGDVDVRQTAVEALAGYKKDAVPALLTVLREQPPPEVRRLAVLTLAEIGPDAADSVPLLRPLFLDPTSGVQDEAAAALGKIGKPAVPVLADALQTDPTTPPVQVMLGFGSPWALLGTYRDYAAQHRRALTALGQVGPDALDVLVGALSSPNRDIREQAAGVLGGIGYRDRRVVLPLVEAMRDPEPGVRKQAGWALQTLSPEGRTLVPGLARALHDPNVEIRFNAVSFLGQLGPSAVPPLVEALKDKDVKVQREAVQRLQELRVHDETLLPAVVPLLKDESPVVRQNAVAVLHRCGGMAIPHFLAALKDPDAKVREQAVQALQTIPGDSETLLPPLTAALQDDDPLVRGGAATAMGRFGVQAVPRLKGVLKDKDPTVRARAVQALHKLGALAAVLPLLPPLLKDDSAPVRQAVVAALAKFRSETVPDLVGALADTDKGVWNTARTVLHDMEAPQKVLLPALLKALKSEDANTRQGAAYAIGRYGADAVPALVEALKDPNPNVQAWAADSLDNIGPPARKAIPALVDVALATPKDEVRKTAVMALVTIQGLDKYRRDSLKAIPDLIELLKDPDADTRWGAAQTLAAIGPPAREAVPALTEALKDSNLSVSQSAQFALDRIQARK